MKRSTLKRKRKPLAFNAERAAWKEPQRGYCAVCHKPCWRLHRHHVVTEQHVRREGGNPWALANSMLICEQCHTHHHSAYKKISRSLIPVEAVSFAERLLGAERAHDYFGCYYGDEGA